MIRRDDSNNTYNNMEKLHSFLAKRAKTISSKIERFMWDGRNGMAWTEWNEWMCCECEYWCLWIEADKSAHIRTHK